MNRRDPAIRELLAAEYVLGSLRGPARRRFSQLLRTDRELTELVQFWEIRLADIAGTLSPETPHARVWTAIQNRLGHTERQTAAVTLTKQSPWAQWGKYLVSGMALVMLVVGIQISAPPTEDALTGATTFQASDFNTEIVITNEWGGAQWRIRGNRGERFAQLEVIQNPPIPADRDLEMWFIADASSAPVSLWLCPDQPGSTVEVELAQPLSEGATFAVSLEPRGGSPEPGPTGPVLFAATYSS